MKNPLAHTTTSIALLLASAAFAQTDVRVVVTGVVERNDFVSGTYAGVPAGSPVTMTINLDSTNFLNSTSFPVRGYRFFPENFSLTIGSVTNTLRTTPTPPAYFVIRNNDPRADGFYISQGVDYDTHIPLNMTPNNYGIAFNRTFNINTPSPIPDNTLNSLNLLEAVGSWGFENLSVYNFNVELGEFSTPLIMEYQTITITHCASIAAQPEATNSCASGPAIFSVSANGSGNVTYTWEHEAPLGTWTALSDGSNAGIGIASGAQSSTLTLTNLGAAAVGNYRAIVSNSCGTGISDPAALTLCLGDADCDGDTDSDDIVAFFTAWDNGESEGDVDGDGDTDSDDIITFFNAWDSGC